MYKWINWWAQINFIKTNPSLVDGGRNNLSFTPRIVLESSWFRDETEDPQRWSNSTPHGPHRNWGSGDSPTAIASGWRLSHRHQALSHQSERQWWCKFGTEYLGWARLCIGAGDPAGNETNRVPAPPCSQPGQEGRWMNKYRYSVYEGGTLNLELESVRFPQEDPGWNSGHSQLDQCGSSRI